jgi:hypothetical protein
MFKKYLKIIRRALDLEILFFSSGLIYLAVINPNQEGHFNFCLARFFGFEHCPGCGLGRSISYFLHGEVVASLKTHPLGIATVLILIARFYKLLKVAPKY